MISHFIKGNAYMVNIINYICFVRQYPWMAGTRMLDLDQALSLSGNGLLGLSVNSKFSKTP